MNILGRMFRISIFTSFQILIYLLKSDIHVYESEQFILHEI